MDKSYSIINYFFKKLILAFLFAFNLALTTLPAFVPSIAVAETDSEFLSTDKAFILNARLVNTHQVELNFSIAPGYLLYRDHFQFRTLTGQPIILPNKLFPPTITKRDEMLGEEYRVYKKSIQLMVSLPSSPQNTAGLRVQYQGCAENGFCYSPVAKKIVSLPDGKIQITEISSEEFNKKENDAIQNSVKDKNTEMVNSESDRITSQLKSGSLPLTLMLFLGLGLLLSFTPCVLPMVPILANILVGPNKPLSSRRATTLASLYVLSVAVCYAIAGAIAGLMGSQLQQTLQKPLFLVILSIILLLFALNQFGLLRVRLPSFLTHALHQLHLKQKQGSAFGAIAMGCISALMVSPCVTPALVGALTYIGQTGNALLGGLVLFSMALGMGLPLLGVACIGSHLLPKAGPWMGYIKILTGLLLLILAGSIFIRAFPPAAAKTEAIMNQAHFIPVQHEKEFNQILNSARHNQKTVLLDVYADWCVACRQLDHTLFENPHVLAALKNMVVLRLDLSHQTKDNMALQKKLDIIGPPTLLFFDKQSIENKKFRLVGTIESTNFISHVKQFLNTVNTKK